MGWQQVNPHGSGFQNAGGVGPWAGQDSNVLSGGDTSGVHHSTNKGKLFANRNGSIAGVDVHIASIEPHPTQSGRWFILTGNGTSGSVFESTNNGETWTDVSTGQANIFGDGALAGNSGANSLLGNGNGEHPRSVGRLISIDATGGYIYVGTFKQGVYRGTLGASSGVSSWTRIGLAPATGNYYVRGVLYDAAQGTLYASTFSDPGSDFTTLSGYVWRSTNPSAGSPAFTQLTGSPMCGSAMVVISDRLYMVAHPITANLSDRGLWYLNSAHSASAGAAWTKISAVPTSGAARWMSLDGYKSGTNTVLWAGSASDGTQSLCRVTDAGGSWAGVIYPTNFSTTTHNDMGGPNTPADPWWMYTARAGMMLGHGSFVASTIRVNPQNTQEVYVFGRSGAWRSLDGGANWYPIVKGIGATVTLTVIADPVTQGRVYVGLGDWSILTSNDNLATVQNNPPPTGSFAYSTALDESTTPPTLYTAASPRQDSASFNSLIYSNPNVLGSGAWATTGFTVSNAIVTGLAVCYSGTTRVILATTSNGQLWRKSGGNAWAQIPDANQTPSGGLNFSSTDTTPFARKLDRAETYMYDRSTGIWRSADAGLHWTRIWNHASGNSDQAGWVAVHPTNPAVIYVSDHTSVYKITNANTAGQDAATVVTIGNAIGARGPMAIDPVNNKIGVCDITATPRWWESDLATINWVDKSDQLYQNEVAAPQWASYDRNGNALVALSGNGMIGETSTNAPPVATISTPTAGQSFPSGTTSVTLSGTVTDDAAGATAAYTLDGGSPVALTLTSGAFSRSVAVAAGTHTIVVTATDAQGLTNSKTVAFSVAAVVPPADTTPPTLTVSNPSADATVPNATTTQTVAGTASDNVSLTSVTVNGTPVTVSGGSFSTSVSLAVGSNTITVTATDSSNNKTIVTRTITRSQADVPPFFTTRASITGSPIAGNTLTGVDGAVTGSPTPTLGSRVWRKTDGTQVGTGQTFVVPSSTLDGETLTYEVVATNTAGSATSVSAATAAVSTPVNPPIWTVAPSITGQTGNGQSGDTLTGHDGTFSPGSVSSRKWQSSPTGLAGTEVDIGGATSTSFTVTDTQVGGYVRYYVDAVNSGVHNTNVSAWIGPIAAAPSSDVAPSNTVAPSISGTAMNGQTLTLDQGQWDGSPTPTITQQWKRVTAGVTTSIPNATDTSYTQTANDIGSTIKATVTATNTVTSVSVTTAPTAVVLPIPNPVVQQVSVDGDLLTIELRLNQRGLS